MQKILVSDQYAPQSQFDKPTIPDTDRPVIESALQHANLKTLAVRTSSDLGVTLSELPVSGLLVLRTRTEQAALAAALKSTLSLELPGVLSAHTANDIANVGADSPCIRWIAPDEWLLSCPLQDAFNIETDLRQSFNNESSNNPSLAIVNVSGGYTTLILHGAHANDVLKKSTGYDVHPSTFTPGKVVNTVFAKSQLTLRCLEYNHYELIVRRSFADYVWHWIQVAAAEYGMSIEVD